MDMGKIGAFLAALRTGMGLTQQQLGEQLGVTNKTVSRWETGAYLPPAEMLLQLSALYGVSINELLSSQRLSSEQYREYAETNLQETVRASAFTLKERKDFFAKKWCREHWWEYLLVLLGYFVGLVLFMKWESELGLVLELAAIGLLLWLGNRRAAYIEHHSFDGKG